MTTANLASITPFFIVADLRASVAYYVGQLGFTLDFEGPPDDVYYAQVSREGARIMLKVITPDVLPVPNHARHPWARWDAYVYTHNPDALHAECVQRGANIVTPLSFIDDGLWGFEIADADGYVLAFFTTDAPRQETSASSPATSAAATSTARSSGRSTQGNRSTGTSGTS